MPAEWVATARVYAGRQPRGVAMERRWATDTPDAELIAAAQAGAAGAFALLVERYYAPVLRTLARQTGDRELAADLAQETFEGALRSLDRLRPGAPFAPWLYGIARHRRQATARRRRLRRLVALDWLPTRERAGHPALRADDPATGVAARDLVQHALDALRPAEREVLLLRQEWGFAGAEVAAILGVTPAAARRRLARATARFRARYRALAGEGGGDGDDALL